MTATHARSDFPSVVAIDLGNGVKMEFVAIPAGQFQMGLDLPPKPVQTARLTRHTVRITRPFYMGKYQVTQQQWEAVMGDNPSHFKGAENPVEQVLWEHCLHFLRKLSAEVPGGLRCGLPTEAEWEYACRAGTTTEYSFGDNDDQLAEHGWFSGNSGQTTHPVGRKKPNAFGLYDMHGNVYEWCHDWYDPDYYEISPRDDPTGPTRGEYRVLRGGAWLRGPEYCGSAWRFIHLPAYPHTYHIGFRAVLRASSV